MVPFSENYSPTPIESDIFLSDIPIDLMEENIAEQFDDPLEYNTDYISVFIDKYQCSMKEIDEDAKEQLDEIRNEMFSFILKQFQDHYGIGIPEFADIPISRQDTLVLALYQVFVLNIKKTLTRLVVNYVKKNGEGLSEISANRKKSVTYLSLKKEVEDPVALAVLSDISAVIDHIVSLDMDIDEFLNYARYDNNYMEIDIISKAYDNYEITGNFVDPCFNLMSFDLRQEIESKVRNKLLKKYGKRGSKVEPIIEELEPAEDSEID